MTARKPRPDLVDRATVEAMIAQAVAAERGRPAGLTDPFPTVAYQKQRVQIVARVLCGLDDVEPGDPSSGAQLFEAARYVAAFDILRLHSEAVAAARREIDEGTMSHG